MIVADQRVVATFGLPPTALTEVPTPVTLDADAAQASYRWAATERMTGLWCAAAGAGLLQLPAASLDAARASHTHALRVALACEATMAEVTQLLDAAHVPSWLHKGAAVAQLDHADPAWRTFADADMYVRRDHLHRAVAVLEAAGFRRAKPAHRPWWERRFLRGIGMLSPDGVEVDLHVALVVGWFGERLDHDALVALGTDTVDLGGVACRAFGPEGRFLAACYAAELSRGTGLRYLRDLAQLLLVTECDWRAAARLAGHDEGDAVIARAVRRAVTTLGLDPAHPAATWAAEVQPSPTAARALALAEAGWRDEWRADAKSSMLAYGPVERVRFLAGIAFPSKAVRDERGWTVRDEARRAAAFLRAGR
ncbi:MAG: nucleotidyltransferase family protein [Ilumatobacteraceae bacterium]